MWLWPSLVTILALLMYLVVSLNVGLARGKYKVPAPMIAGNPDFERRFRVQQNTVEQLLLFLPSLWLFSQFVSPVWGAGFGSVWIVGRIVYAWGYYRAAEKRAIGFAISLFMTIFLLLGALVGIIRKLVA